MINLDLEAKRFNQTCNHQNLATSISGNPFSIFDHVKQSNQVCLAGTVNRQVGSRSLME